MAARVLSSLFIIMPDHYLQGIMLHKKHPTFCSMLCYLFRVATAPVLESMQAREPGLQAPSDLAGSKIKITHFPPLLILSQRYPIMVKEPIIFRQNSNIELNQIGHSVLSQSPFLKFLFCQN